MRSIFNNWSKWELAWLGLFSVVALVLSLYWGDTLFGFSVFLTGVICVVLVAKSNIWNYAWGTYNVAGYAWISYQNGFFGEVMLNAGFFLPMQLVGFLMWKRKMQTKTEVIRKTMKPVVFGLVLVLSATAVGLYGYLLSTLEGQASPYIDAATTVLSIVAMILMALRYAEQWAVWIVVNIMSITMWTIRLGAGVDGAIAMVVMWSAYLVNSIYGYMMWRKPNAEEK